jgi:glutathione peroxidase
MNIYNFSFKTHQGKEVNLSSYAGCVLLLVNTATKCGLAPQFRELEVLHKKYQDSGLVVIGFPCEQFLGQEPETNETVAHVCEINFGVTFLLSEKIEVNGKNTHPLFAYLKKTLPSGFLGDAIKWNFTKFLIDRNGVPYKRYSPVTKPRAFEKDIEKLLN